jgi:hypothetical protein
MYDVILMVTKGYFLTAERLCEVKELLATLPGAQEAGRFRFEGVWCGGI